MMTLLIARLTLQELFAGSWSGRPGAEPHLHRALRLRFPARRRRCRSVQRSAGRGAAKLLPREVQMSIMVMLGLWTVNFLAGVMTIFAAVGAISSEIEAGTLHVIVTKPLARFEIIAGKYLGFLTMIVIYITMMVSGVLLTAYYVGDYTPPNVHVGLALMILVATILLSLTMLGSTIFSTMANGVVVFMLYGMALTGGLVEQIGTSLDNDTMIRIGVASSVLVPSDSMWKLASYKVQPAIAVSLTGPNPFGTFVPPSDFAVRYAIFYCLAVVLLSMAVFHRKDL
ncbi:MAG: ABC transporter permease [Thermomicrobiales bacterium]